MAIPGIIQSFDAAKQTATVQPAITENIKIGNRDAQAMNLPILSDVPVQFPRAGGYSVTFPVKSGDECLLVFADMCIDGWWQSGGVQNQMERRRHDLSDAIAIIGITSVPNAVTDYSTDAFQARSDDGSTYIEIKTPNIKIVATDVTIEASTVNIKAPLTTIDGNLVVTGEATISEIPFTPHKHSEVSKGGDKSGPPEKG